MAFLFWALIGAIIGIAAAQRRGFSTAAGFVGGLLLGPLAFLMFFVSQVSHRRTCPYCAEPIQDRAVVCKHCHRDLAPFVKSA